MAEAASTYIMNDSALLDLIANHHRLWQEWDRRVAADRNPDTQLLSVRCDELARRIIATPAHTREALDGKLRVV